MTNLEALKAITNYPIPSAVFTAVGVDSGIDLMAEYDGTIDKAKALVYKWLSTAPAVSELGVSSSFTDSEKQAFLKQAEKLDPTIKVNSGFGYFEI